MLRSPSSSLVPAGIRDRVAVVVEVDDKLLRAANLPVVADTTLAESDLGDRALAANQFGTYTLGVLENGEKGTIRAMFLDASMPSGQVAYNYEVTDDDEARWPRLVQNWIVPRASFTGTRMTSGIVAPPALGRTWTRTGEREVRFQNGALDGLFILLQITWEDISSPLRRQRIDVDSGRIVTVEIRKVPAGTAGQQVDAQGHIREIDPINTRWALETKDAVSGLVGVGVRDYRMHRPYPWPKVMVGFALVNNVDLSIGYEYQMKQWDDECLIDVLEYWSPTRPAVPSPTVLGATSIRWNGVLVPNINIEPCLHSLITITEFANSRTRFKVYPATRYQDWPASVTIYPSVRPHPKGGYYVTRWIVYAPQGVIV